jgi:hypothetical protein
MDFAYQMELQRCRRKKEGMKRRRRRRREGRMHEIQKEMCDPLIRVKEFEQNKRRRGRR